MANYSEASKAAQSRIQVLSEKVDRLEYSIEQLMMLVDRNSAPFIYYAMEAKMTQSQVSRFYDLMEAVEQSIDSDKPMSHLEFERESYAIVPQKRGDYSFARSLVVGLRLQEMYERAYEHLRKSGMNIPVEISRLE
jgi:vacuolar-type H+-ATPase subunit I/STV1